MAYLNKSFLFLQISNITEKKRGVGKIPRLLSFVAVKNELHVLAAVFLDKAYQLIKVIVIRDALNRVCGEHVCQAGVPYFDDLSFDFFGEIAFSDCFHFYLSPSRLLACFRLMNVV